MAVRGISRDSWVEVDLQHIANNVRSFRHHLQDDTALMAVVKADGYGHGAIDVANTALKAGASWLGVALLDEALALRDAGIKEPILVFGWVRPEDVQTAAENHISLTVFQRDWLVSARKQLTGNPSLNIHLKIDSGMGRIGTTSFKEVSEIADVIKESSCFRMQGTFTHFATADESDSSYFTKQYQRFKEMLLWLEKVGLQPGIVHCANSAATIHFPEKTFHLSRIGIAMYGLSPSFEMREDVPFPLKPAFSLHSRLVHVKKINPGDAISYGATYVAEEEEWIGTVPIGYADGWLRRIANNGEVIINGEKVPIVGRICMDFFMVKLPRKMEIGAKVTLIGKQGDCEIHIDDLARQLDTISYEIPCMIGDRVPRFYK
ncbi:MAG TPA: alanine racemase [Bacillales bacterium]|nr:alanine racemase [Bacillales bacterium]